MAEEDIEDSMMHNSAERVLRIPREIKLKVMRIDVITVYKDLC